MESDDFFSDNLIYDLKTKSIDDYKKVYEEYNLPFYVTQLMEQVNNLQKEVNYLKSYVEVEVGWKLFREGAKMPERKTEGAAAYDVYACLEEPLLIKSHSTEIINTGLNVYIPRGYEIQIRSRSGLAANDGLFILNTPGTIDSCYSSDEGESKEIKIILHNISDKDYLINHNDRVAQIVVSKLLKIKFYEYSELKDKSIGGNRIGRFGSTGK